ncbi:hypothetical protein GCM10022251_38100 [Phytohabitans flavus]|uniref:DUF6458 domain-containing protein n=1 Tax=Phytohabitans flavus TaxID=1076124 RepID=A0A6F8XVM3_9ACTN|nr:DUF6458 family protein [Phytohabitans flavus]BCB77873.1 hypothetical protein Pflav_042830 [Phytohabitans flavus]
MGISGGIFLIALGALLTFAVNVAPSWIDLKATGVIIMLAGGAVLLLTLWYWQNRRRRVAAQYQYRYQRPPPAPQGPEALFPPRDAGRPTKASPADPPSTSPPTDGT